MPLAMKTLREAAIELGMPENELRLLVDLRKARAVMKKGVLTFAPDELARIRRLRKTVVDSGSKSSAPAPAAAKTPAPAKAAPPKVAPPPRAAAPRPPVRPPVKAAAPAARPAPPRLPPVPPKAQP